MFCYFTKSTRYYALELKNDLFDIVVVKHYGRINTRLGRTRTHAFDSNIEAQEFFASECKRRLKRGYSASDDVTN
jgi:predicted DNA-binding WGR domain protein